jgi:hypothetical protein
MSCSAISEEDQALIGKAIGKDLEPDEMTLMSMIADGYMDYMKDIDEIVTRAMRKAKLKESLA